MKRLTTTIALLGLSGMPLLAVAADATAPADQAAPADSATNQADLEKQLDDARAKLQEYARKVADLSMQLNGPVTNGFYRMRYAEGGTNHGQLGLDVTTDTQPGQGGAAGAVVSDVTPGSPADKAGLKAGDVITVINGTSLKPSGDESAFDKLVDAMHPVKPGDSVSIAYSRNGKAATTKATAESARDVLSLRLPAFMQRPVIGVDLGPDNGDGSVTVVAVTPDGPADKAGLQAGDQLTSIDGVPLKAQDGKTSRDALFAAMDRVQPGEKVTVGYSRDGKAATAGVTTVSPRDFFFSFHMPPMPPMGAMTVMAPGVMAPEAPMAQVINPGFFLFGGDGWGEMQLANMSPGLGKYFGTDKGLLVLNAPKDSALQLQDGDVITSIGGRDPGNPAHAMRILRSYGPGESVKLEIMRKGKSTTLNVTLPKAHGYSGDPNSSSAFDEAPDQDGDDDTDDDGR